MKRTSIIIGGTGRNTGKTTLACEIIKKLYKQKISTYGIKISTHFHHQAENSELLKRTNNYQIYNEKSKEKNKDSSRMLKSGAKKVFYIQAKEEFVKSAFDYISKDIPNNSIIICESFTLIKQKHDGINILMLGGEKNISPKDTQDINYSLYFNEITIFVNKITVIEQSINFGDRIK